MTEAPIPIRGHLALCLLGFGGEGYSPAFIEHMAGLKTELWADPTRRVTLIAAPDGNCGACPHLVEGGCTLGGPGHEAHMRAHDEAVLARLALAPGDVLSWDDLLERIRTRVGGSDLPGLCTTCPWLPMGVCEKAVETLRTEGRPAPWERRS